MCVGERFEVTAEPRRGRCPSCWNQRSDSGIICLALRRQSAGFGGTPTTQSSYHVDNHIVTMHKDQPAQSATPTGFFGADVSSVSRTVTSSRSRHAEVMPRCAAPAAAHPRTADAARNPMGLNLKKERSWRLCQLLEAIALFKILFKKTMGLYCARARRSACLVGRRGLR